MRGYNAVAEEFGRHNVECAFVLMGEDIAELLIAMDSRGIQCYGARHENQAVAMADSYARSTGKLGVAVLTGGPGFTNAMTAIMTASRARSTVLVVVGAGQTAEDDPHRTDLRDRKYFPHVPVCEAAGIAVVKPASSSTVVTDARTAILATAAGRTTVLNLAVDVLDGDAEEPSALPTAFRAPALAPDPDAIVALADFLEETWAVSRPVILAGYGALASGADAALRRLGTLTGSLLSTTLRAAGFFDDDPHNIGICGTYATPVAAELIASADCVLVFGATLNRYTTYGGTMFPNARVVQVDDDQGAFGRFVPIEEGLAIHADVTLAVEALVAELERRGHKAGGYRSRSVPLAVADFDRNAGVRDQSLPDKIDPRTLMIELDRMLPANRMLALDNGHNFTFAIEHIRVRGPRNIVQLNDAGSIGLGIGTGIGAAVGRPGTFVVVPVGDAGFLMALGDLETAVRYKLPMVVVISNDEALGLELHFLNLIGMPAKLAEFPTPSFAAIASAIGAEAFTVRSAADLGAVEERLRQPLSGPLVLDCRINGAIRAEWLEFAMGRYALASPRRSAST